MKTTITSTKGDEEGAIDDLIDFLQTSKSKGATHYSMRWSNDPMWAFKWFETYRVKSNEEIKQERIKELQRELDELTNKF